MVLFKCTRLDRSSTSLTEDCRGLGQYNPAAPISSCSLSLSVDQLSKPPTNLHPMAMVQPLFVILRILPLECTVLLSDKKSTATALYLRLYRYCCFQNWLFLETSTDLWKGGVDEWSIYILCPNGRCHRARNGDDSECCVVSLQRA